jgi:hypothetical protein
MNIVDVDEGVLVSTLERALNVLRTKKVSPNEAYGTLIKALKYKPTWEHYNNLCYSKMLENITPSFMGVKAHNELLPASLDVQKHLQTYQALDQSCRVCDPAPIADCVFNFGQNIFGA